MFACWEERELAGSVWVLRSLVTHTPRVKLGGSSLVGLAGPWDVPLASLQCLPPLWKFPWPGSAGVPFGNRCQRVQTLLRSLCTWPHLRRRMVRAPAPRLLLDQAPTGHSARLSAGWEVVGKKSHFPGGCRVVSAGSHDPTTAHLLFPVWCPAASPRFRCAEGQLVGGWGGAENGECFHFSGPHSSPSERKA